MHEALELLNDLQPGDVEAILAAGTEQALQRDDLLVREGATPEHLWIVLEGLLEVRLGADAEHALTRLGPGELVGEVSLLEDRPASAAVRAVEDGIVLAVPRAALEARSAADPAFAARLYRALGRTVARRLRARSEDLQRLATARTEAVEPVDRLEAWRALAPVLDGFKELMQRADVEGRKHGDGLPDELVAAGHAGIDTLCRALTEAFGDGAETGAGARSEMSARVQREIYPYVLLTRVVERILTKPRGYAGDFLTIEWMYRNEPGGSGAVGPLIDRAFLERPAARAVRNRRKLLAEEIRAVLDAGGGRVMSLACGPAEELFDVFAALDDPSRLKATLLDIDLQALALVSDRRDREGLKRSMDLHQGNLVYLATGRAKLDLPAQDLVYSIGLIDYFQDRFVVALLDWIHDRLRPGGRVILGNFHPSNPDRALMEHVLDWHLIHRDEADMNRLFEASRFGAPCERIRFEEAGVNLFAVGVKA